MRRVLNLILIVSVFIILTGCQSKQEFSDCIDGNCTVEEKYEVVDEFIDSMFEEVNNELSNEEFDLRLELDVFDEYYSLQLYYTNSQGDYLDGYDIIAELYDVFTTVEAKLILLDNTKEFELKVELNYTNGSSYFSFFTSEVNNYRNFNIVSNDDFNSLGDYLEDNIEHFDEVFAYGNNDLNINMILAATAHAIEFRMEKGLTEVVVTISDQVNDIEECISFIETYVAEHVDSKYIFTGDLEN